MGGDYTRFTFRPRKLYSAVLKQQGRVSVEADFNEHADIDDRRWRAETLDIMGSTCIVPRFTPDAFRMFLATTGLVIGPGRMYVDGILVENFGTGEEVFKLPLAELVPQEWLPFGNQPFLVKDPAPTPLNTTPGSTHLAFLDVWQREITALEDAPANPKDLRDGPIREVALGGPDTATRIQTAWQVRLLEAPGATTCEDAIAGWNAMVAPSSGRLTATAPPGPPSVDECLIEPGGGYRGLENRLYRVEIHSGGPVGAGATFKWSRDNGSVVAAVTDIPAAGAGSQITVSRIGRDEVLRFQVNDWVEVLDDYVEFQQTPRKAGHLAKVTAIDEANRILTIDPPLAAGDFKPAQPSRHTRVRRWDQRVGNPGVDATTGLIPASSTVIELESGITVSFSAAAATSGMLRPGDYWVFAARTTIGSIEELDQAPPRGIHHHFCRLALITWGSGATSVPPALGTPARSGVLLAMGPSGYALDALRGAGPAGPFPHDHFGHTHSPGHTHAAGESCPPEAGDGTVIIDCREFWPPKAGCCTEVVELGESIQEAINRLPPSGGCVCLKTGIHDISSQLTIAKSNVVLHGEGPGATIRHRSGEAMLRIAAPTEATIDNVMVHDLRFEATDITGRAAMIELHRVADASLEQCVLAGTSPTSRVLDVLGVLISDSSRVRLARNVLLNLRGGVMAVRSGRIDLIDNQLRGPTDEVATGTSASVGIIGIGFEDDVVGPSIIEHNLVENYQRGIILGLAAEASVVAHNWVERSGTLPRSDAVLRDISEGNPFGRRASDRPSGSLRLFAIETAADGCTILGNFMNLTDPAHGGVHVTGSHTQVERNEIRSDLDPPERDGQPVVEGFPLGIYLEQSAEAPRLDHCLVRGNRLAGLLDGIIVRDTAVARTFSNYIVENRLEGPPEALFDMRDLTARLRAVLTTHPELLPLDRAKTPLLIRYLGAVGILADNTEEAIVSDNHVQNFVVGIELVRGAAARVDGNRVLTGLAGLYAYDSDDTRMSDNIFDHVLVGLLGQELERGEIRGTLVTEVEAVGILLVHGRGAKLAGSRVEGGEVGILLGNEQEGAVTGSDIVDTGLFGMLDLTSADITYAHNRVARTGGRAVAGGIVSLGNAAAVTVESCDVISIGRSFRKLSGGAQASTPQWVTAIGVVGAHACRIHADRVSSAEDLPSTAVNLPVLAFSSSAGGQSVPARRAAHGVEMLDNVIVTPALPSLVLGNASATGTMLFSNNRCQQTDQLRGGWSGTTPAQLILQFLLNQSVPATVVLSGKAQVVTGNRVTSEFLRQSSFSFSNTGNLTAMGNITDEEWIDIPAAALPMPLNGFNHLNVS